MEKELRGLAQPVAAPPGLGNDGVFIDDEKLKQKKIIKKKITKTNPKKHIKKKKKDKRNLCRCSSTCLNGLGLWGGDGMVGKGWCHRGRMGSQGKGHRELIGLWEGEGAAGRESHHGKGIVL